MIYCVRTTMVTTVPPVNSSVAAGWTGPQTGLKFMLLAKRELVDTNDGFYEARRIPEVRDDNSNPVNISIPTVDAWKATTKDRKVLKRI